MAEFRDCSSCGSAHMGVVPCGLSYAERLGSVVVDKMSFDTAERHSYYDPEPIRQVFGEDSAERMFEETQGLGYTREDEHGVLRHKDRKSGDWVPVTEEQLDRVYLGGDTEREVG